MRNSKLMIGLIPIMIYQGASTSTPIDWIGILIVFVSGFVTFVPLIMFYGIVSRADSVE